MRGRFSLTATAKFLIAQLCSTIRGDTKIVLSFTNPANAEVHKQSRFSCCVNRACPGSRFLSNTATSSLHSRVLETLHRRTENKSLPHQTISIANFLKQVVLIHQIFAWIASSIESSDTCQDLDKIAWVGDFVAQPTVFSVSSDRLPFLTCTQLHMTFYGHSQSIISEWYILRRGNSERSREISDWRVGI